MRICMLGLDNLPVLAPEHADERVGGAQVQQTLLARALVRAGHDVSMVVRDHGQPDAYQRDGIRTLKAYASDDGLPGVRFAHPRWTKVWSALRRADADLYYTSCAGMQVGLLAAFCRRYRKPFVFRVASDSDCDPDRLLVRFARDRWLYAYGLRRADAILAQSMAQGDALAGNYGLPSRPVGSLVEIPPAPAAADKDVDVLWVGNLWRLKRPDLALALAAGLPNANVMMVGGAMPGEQALFDETLREAAALPNVVFYGRMPYERTKELYARARLLVNTSETEGFPNTFLQAWASGVPVVSLFDPDGLIEREGLGVAAGSFAELASAVQQLLADSKALRRAGERCRAFMLREYDERAALAPYLETFRALVEREPSAHAPARGPEARNV